MKNIGNRFTVLADQSGMQLSIAGARYIEGECIPGLAQVVISHAQALELGNALIELAKTAAPPVAPAGRPTTARGAIDAALEAARINIASRRPAPWEDV